jgi:hypothetical protein
MFLSADAHGVPPVVRSTTPDPPLLLAGYTSKVALGTGEV